jgi:hypothetical protein
LLFVVLFNTLSTSTLLSLCNDLKRSKTCKEEKMIVPN